MCQVGVCATYASRHGYALAAKRLFMPETWFGEDDAERRHKCQVPEELRFQTKLQLAAEMVKAIRVEGRLPCKYLVADCLYGKNSDFLDAIDACVTQWALKALESATLTLSLEATARLEHTRQALDQLWCQHLERAARHDRVVEPEHRLVARQLAKDWEAKRTAQRQLQEEYERFVHTRAHSLSSTERDAIAQLAQNIPALWHAPTTTVADRKERLRQIIQRVIVQAEGESERLQITIEWVGGGTTAGITTPPIRRTEALSYYPLLCERIRQLAAEGYSTVKITACLAQEGFRSP